MSRHRKPWTCRWLNLHQWDCENSPLCEGDHRCIKCGKTDPLTPRQLSVPGGMHAL